MLVTLGERKQMKDKSYITCCYGCEDRTVGCHGSCQWYQLQKEEHQKQKKSQRHYVQWGRFLDGYAMDEYDKGEKDGRKKDVHKESDR